jgi:predicted nucleic acid-binding protein
MCVVDASAGIEVALRRPLAAVLSDQIARAEWVTAPTLYIAEVSNTMWKYHRYNGLPCDVCEIGIGDALAIPDNYADDADLAREAFALAAQIRRPVYDAFYLVLARRHDGCLLTLDQGLKAVARKSAVRVSPA